MASTSNSKTLGKRVCRKRKPPLTPRPPLQFVVASHPDEFKARETMRNVRSHVMYKHNEQRGFSPSDRTISQEGSRALSTTRTPSPMTTNSDGILDTPFVVPMPTRNHGTSWDEDLYDLETQLSTANPFRALTTRLICITTAAPARSAPPTSGKASEYPFPGDSLLVYESLRTLKQEYVSSTDFFCHDLSWMQRICDTRLSFLSHISVACVYQDLADGLLQHSELTVHAKSKVIRMITDRLDTDNHDDTILSILHLLVSELGSFDDSVFEVHIQGLNQLANGMRQLPSRSSVFMTLLMNTFALLRGHADSGMPWGSQQQELNLDNDTGPISPLYAPLGELSPLYRSCSSSILAILGDMYTCTTMFLAGWNPASDIQSNTNTYLAARNARLEQMYTHLLLLPCPSTDDSVSTDWVYESCRLAALIYCRSTVLGVTLAHSANTLHAGSSGPRSSSVTMLSALHEALGRTETRGCWGDDLRGCFLWVSLVGAIASWSTTHLEHGIESHATSTSLSWMRKCFALYAVRAVVSVPFKHADAMLQALRTMSRVRQCIAANIDLQSVS